MKCSVVLAFVAIAVLTACGSGEPSYRFSRRIDDAAISRDAVERYAADQSLWGDSAEVWKLFEPVPGENHLLLFEAEYEVAQIHDDPFEMETRHKRLLLEVDRDGMIVAGLVAPVELDELPHAVSIHYFFGEARYLGAQLPIDALPWQGFLSEELVGKPAGVIDLGRRSEIE